MYQTEGMIIIALESVSELPAIINELQSQLYLLKDNDKLSKWSIARYDIAMKILEETRGKLIKELWLIRITKTYSKIGGK